MPLGVQRQYPPLTTSYMLRSVYVSVARERTATHERPTWRRLGRWIHDRWLTLVMLIVVVLVGQIAAGWSEYNQGQSDHGLPAVTLFGYFTVGHFWEALLNWRAMLAMAAFISLMMFLIRGTRRNRADRGVMELVDAYLGRRRPARRAMAVKRGGWGPRVPPPARSDWDCLLFLLVVRARCRGVGGIARSGTARTGRRGTGRPRHVEPLLVRVVSELAERVSLVAAMDGWRSTCGSAALRSPSLFMLRTPKLGL